MTAGGPWRVHPAVTVAACAATVVIAGCVVYLLAAGPANVDTVDRGSYTKGWTYVDTFQPRTGVSAGMGGPSDFYLGPMTDAEMLDRCSRYAADEPVAAMDGVADPQAFLLACADAVRATDLEP